MTFSKEEFYGSSKHAIFTAGVPSYTIGYGDYTRVLYFTEDVALATVTVNLPDILKVRGRGFMYYFLVNDTSANMEVRDFSGALLETVAAGDCTAVGIQHKDGNIGDWFFHTGTCVHPPPPAPPGPIVSFGGAFLNHDVWLYQYVTDSWSQGTNTPVDSHFAQAVNTKYLVNNDLHSFWKHLAIHYEYSAGADTHTNVTSSLASNEYTGSARLRDGDGTTVEMYLSWSSLAFENIPILYDPATNAWSLATPLTGTHQGQAGTLVNFVTAIASAGPGNSPVDVPPGTWYAYLLIGEPVFAADVPEWPHFWAYQGVQDFHYQLPMIPLVPLFPNRYKATMINIGDQVHVLGGAGVVLQTAVPQDASDRHVVFTGGIGGNWSERPQIPDPLMGIGSSTIPLIENKIIVGMGQHANNTTGSAQNFEYDELTQSYRSRNIDLWSAKNDQEGSWCVAGV